MKSVFLSLFALLAGCVAPVEAAEFSVAKMTAFIAANQSELTQSLQQIHDHEMTASNRFLILTADEEQRYVQCLFHDKDTAIHCEASSGFYGPKPRWKPPASARAAIARIGFKMDDSKGNYSMDIPIEGPAPLWTVAGMMLETLYRGYGGGSTRHIVFVKAPFAQTIPKAFRLAKSCSCK